MIWWGALLLAGGLVGFLAGLLGIGGGMTLVPILASLFDARGLSQAHVVHLALGTGMASIMFTSSASVLEHHRHNAVDWRVVKRMVPGMLAGTPSRRNENPSVLRRYQAVASLISSLLPGSHRVPKGSVSALEAWCQMRVVLP